MLHEALRLWAERWELQNAVRHAGILLIVPESGMKAPDMVGVIGQLVRAGEAVENGLFVWNEVEGLVEVT